MRFSGNQSLQWCLNRIQFSRKYTIFKKLLSFSTWQFLTVTKTYHLLCLNTTEDNYSNSNIFTWAFWTRKQKYWMHLKLLVGDEVQVLPRHQQATWVSKESLSFSVEIAKNKHLPSSLLALDGNTISGRTGSIPNLEFASFPLENAKTTALDFWHFLHTGPLQLHLELL